MRNTKRRLEAFSFFDHTGISRHLEKMASRGWMLEKITKFGWVYRRIEPKNIHFTVSYYPKASEFDPEPSEEQKMFHDFCAHTGWQLVCTSAQMQIFYNEYENPTPIETEPELELQAIHASAKKSFIPQYIGWLMIAMTYGVLFLKNLFHDPIDLLSSTLMLFSGFSFMILAILSIVELVCYFHWYTSAKTAASHGEFLPVTGTSKFESIMRCFYGIGVVILALGCIANGDLFQKRYIMISCIYVAINIVIVNATMGFLKHKKMSASDNRMITLITSCVVGFVMLVFTTFLIFNGSLRGLFSSKSEETYEYKGVTLVIYQDELPLVIEDLIDVDYDGYIKEQYGNMSLILGHYTMYQYPRLDALNYTDIPRLEYTMTIVKVPALYNMCKERLMYENEVLRRLNEHEYQAEEAKPWGANDAYRLYDPEYGFTNEYLLCYDNLLVEISFDWEPTIEQMAAVGEKLNRAEF